MNHVLVWTEKRGWLSPDRYPLVHDLFTISEIASGDEPPDEGSLVIVDGPLLRDHPGRVRELARASQPLSRPVVAIADVQTAVTTALDDLVFDVLPESPSENDLLRTLRNATYVIESRRRLLELQVASEQKARELEELNAIGIALSAERDHNRLLNLILSKAREITRADAGSLFLAESIDEPIGREDKVGDRVRVQGRWLVFRVAQNDSRELSFREEILEITPASIAGYVAGTGETLNIENAYHLPSDKPFTINRSFDESTGYLTHSMLVVPMQNREGDTIGVLQLINKKRSGSVRLQAPGGSMDAFDRDVIPFSTLDEQLVRSLASQAAVSVENNGLYQRIEKLFADFVEASVRAIESRDPTTRGHSRRVAVMTTELAQVTSRLETGPYRDLRLTDDEIRELKYAALLHDFGKVGVREKVLVKATKLYSGEMSLVRERLRTVRRTAEALHLRAMLAKLRERGGEVSDEELAEWERDLEEEMARVGEAERIIEAANRPTVTDFSDFERLKELGDRMFPDVDGTLRPYLAPREIDALSIARGTLTPQERESIQSHVVHTYDFLSTIPWTKDLQRIPKLARSHHEKLDGTGYPNRLLGSEIPPQTRMMTIADIFDALAASDRPYKPAVPSEKALDILNDEARHGRIDEELLRLFIEAKVYELGRQT